MFKVPTDVPAITVKMLFPNEYNNNKNIPRNIFAVLATKASSTTKTGVEQGEEKIPSKIPGN